MNEPQALITNPVIILGLLFLILAVIFRTSANPRFKTFYTFVPALLLCYFIPSLLSTYHIVGDYEVLNKVAKNYLLPASLALFCISIDFQGLRKLGLKALIMFFTATVGIIIGGPVALLILTTVSPATIEAAGGVDIWRGLSTVAGSWMGGGANQMAMKEVFEVSDELFSMMVTIDIITANIWMAVLLYGAGISERLDRWLNADNSAIKEVQERIENYQSSIARMPQLSDTMSILGVGFACTAIAHFGGDYIGPWMETNAKALAEIGLSSSFFWVVIIATTLGMLLSFTSVRKLEGVGASRIGSLFLYFLIATIGLDMNIFKIIENPALFVLGILWMLTHITLLLVVAKLIRAPFFFVAVGSQANVGGAASAPVVASAFRPSLAIVGVLLAVLGYAIGTYGAIFTAYLMQLVVN